MEWESENERGARVEKLWKSLHTSSVEPLDFEGLKQGLQKIDHPLANADNILRDIVKLVDTSGDGKIDYGGKKFLAFVEHAEKELWQLFKSIDRDHNGHLDEEELRVAFERAGIKIDSAKLDRFFEEMDSNHDGRISFEEWRNFLLFLPAHNPNLGAVLSYYSSSVSVNPEGDVHVSDESRQGLGTTHFLRVIFGVLFTIANHRPPLRRAFPSGSLIENIELSTSTSLPVSVDPRARSFPWDPGEDIKEQTIFAGTGDTALSTAPPVSSKESLVRLLTAMLPDPGYFIAGGIAGAVSRTATAPLDRLKVYLIAQTSVKNEAVNAAKSGAPIQAIRSATRPLVEATLSLWKMGGVRSLFAGNGLNVVKVMPESAIKFGSYEGAKRVAARIEGHNDPKSLHPWSQFFAAGTGGMISQFAIYPLDTLKFRMQCETVEGGLQGNKLIIATAKKMIRDSGFRAYYRGLGMGLAGMFPYSAIDLTTYEYLKRALARRNMRVRQCSEEKAQPGGMMTGAIGATSSSIGASAVYPLNLLRTRLQSQGTVIHPPTYKGWADCFSKTVKGEGFKGLYRGLTPNLLKVVPSMSISYMVYEASKKVMKLQ